MSAVSIIGATLIGWNSIKSSSVHDVVVEIAQACRQSIHVTQRHEELLRCGEWIGRCRHRGGDGDEWSFLVCIASALIVLISMRGTEQVTAQKPPRPLACVVISPKTDE